MPKDPKLERFVLRFSVFASLFFAIAGILVGLWLSSSFILFDGVYSFLSVIMSWISLRAGVFMLTADKRFPFGKSTIEPFIILFQYGVLLFVIVNAVSVQSMISALAGTTSSLAVPSSTLPSAPASRIASIAI